MSSTISASFDAATTPGLAQQAGDLNSFWAS